MDSAETAENVPFESVRSLDMFLRKARIEVFRAGSLSDVLWQVLIEVDSIFDEAGFVPVDGLEIESIARPTLMRCIAVLEDQKLVEGRKDENDRLYVAVRSTARGHKLIEYVIAGAYRAMRASQESTGQEPCRPPLPAGGTCGPDGPGRR